MKAHHKRRWLSEENTFLWDEVHVKRNRNWSQLADKLGRSQASVKSHYAALRRRNRFLAQHRCHCAHHAAHAKFKDHCTISSCDNYYKKWIE